MNTKVKGYFLGAIAAATYGTNPLFALPLYKDGMDPDSVLFFRYLFAIPILGMMIKGRGRSFKIEHKAAVPLIVMGLLVAFFFISFVPKLQLYGSRDCFYTSFRLSDHGRIDYGTCIQEKLTLQTVFCILLALSGIGLLYKSGDGTTLSLTGVLLVMASALSYAIYIIGVNQSTLKNVATLPLTFYILLFGVSLFFVRVGFGKDLYIVAKWYLWGNLIALAVFPTAISFLCTTSAVQVYSVRHRQPYWEH